MKHTILFTGHMIDAKDRKTPRFPAAKENVAKEAILQLLLIEKKQYGEALTGIAGGASGGDILFHELCEELAIPSKLYLALSKEEFRQRSVAPAGRAWEARFDALAKNLPVEILPQTSGEESVWVRANLWMLHEALKNGGENMTLIALWDGKGGDGKGGTDHMVSVAKESSAKTKIIDVTQL